MSYPPRPPMGMPPMMPPQGYGYPIGMMPMGMGMMPMMPPQMNQNNANMDKNKKKLVPQEIPKKEEKKEEKPPVTTVFVGNISERAPDAMIRQMLQRCGNVLSWKRVQGASGKLQAFGFCEYEAPEATLRAIRLLHNWLIPDKKLVVKVDAKTKALLDDWGRKKKEAKDEENKKKEEDGEIIERSIEDIEEEELDEFTLREDRVAKAGLDAIMREYSAELERVLPTPVEKVVEDKNDPSKKPKKEKQSDGPKDAVSKRNLGLEDMELEEDKKDLINREIRSFRDAHKDDEADRDKDRPDRDSQRDSLQRRRDQRDETRDRERQRERERAEREARDREREREAARRERAARETRSRTPPPPARTTRADPMEEEEEYERRKMERKLRDKELAYQELLKKWEQRERKKAREHDKERERDEDKKMEEMKEARRLKEFLEDYDDERDDPKYYKGGALQRRMKEREKEMEADDRDRQREKEEIEELRRKLTDEGHSDVEGEVARLESERDAHLMPRLNKSPSPESTPERESPERQPLPPQLQQPLQPSHPSQQQLQQQQQALGFHGVIPPHQLHEPESDNEQTGIIIPPTGRDQNHSDSSNDAQNEPMFHGGGGGGDESSDSSGSNSRSQSMSMSRSQQYNGGSVSAEDAHMVQQGFTGVAGPAKDSNNVVGPQLPGSAGADQPTRKKKLTRDEVFNMDEDEDEGDGPKKRKLVPLDYSAEERRIAAPGPAIVHLPKPTTAEEKRRCIKNLIERIPTAKDELFAFPLDWTMVDSALMDKRIRPWVNKKIVEYIGEEEPTLSDFICQKVMGHCAPATILNDIAMVLDEEAEVFVVKMWRLLIYETEAKKLGLVK